MSFDPSAPRPSPILPPVAGPPAGPAAGHDTIAIPVYFDFASSLCHVAHRVMGRMTPVVEDCGIRLDWIPIDLAGLLNWRRGHRVPEARRQHVRGLANALGVELAVPTHWLESCALGALVLHQHGVDRMLDAPREPTLREFVFTRLYEESRPWDEPSDVFALAVELGLEFSDTDLEASLDALEAWTRHAADQMVTGVPTFMLGPWPVGGIQEDATMESILRRWANKLRAEGPD